MFASASLDGAIVLWSSHSISYTRQFNFVKNYEGPNHTYPASAQHVFTVDQVGRKKCNWTLSLFYILLRSIYCWFGEPAIVKKSLVTNQANKGLCTTVTLHNCEDGGNEIVGISTPLLYLILLKRLWKCQWLTEVHAPNDFKPSRC